MRVFFQHLEISCHFCLLQQILKFFIPTYYLVLGLNIYTMVLPLSDIIIFRWRCLQTRSRICALLVNRITFTTLFPKRTTCTQSESVLQQRLCTSSLEFFILIFLFISSWNSLTQSVLACLTFLFIFPRHLGSA